MSGTSLATADLPVHGGIVLPATLRPMRLLVTGGAGFIGANFVHHTVATHPEDDVVVLDALTYAGNRTSIESLPIEFVQGDINDAPLVDELVAGCDVVVHFAAESHNDNSFLAPLKF